MNYLIGTSYRGSLLGCSNLADWHVFEKVPKSFLEQIKSVHVYGLGDCQGALFITYSDEVYNVGFNGFGSLSQDKSTCDANLTVPLKIDGLSHRKIERVRVGLDYGIAISRSGTLYHWGRPVDELHCYGRTLDEDNNHSPHQLVGFCHVAKEAVCGESFFAVLTDNRQVFVTGWIHWGDKFYDKKLISPDSVDIVSVSCGAQHIVMVSTDGSVYTCGWGGDGQLGYPWKESDGYLNAKKVPLPEPCIQSACGRNTTIFLFRFGSIWACGWNDNFSKLGVPSDDIIIECPLQVQLEGRFKEIASSYWSTCSIYAASSCNETSVFKWGHGCWPSSNKLLRDTSMLDAFIDFPTPYNLGFSELPADEIPTSAYNYGSDFDCYVLSTADILFERMTELPSKNDIHTTQPYNLEYEQQEKEAGSDDGRKWCSETTKLPSYMVALQLQKNKLYPPNHGVPLNLMSPKTLFLATLNLNLNLSLWVLVLFSILSHVITILSSLSTRISLCEPFSQAESNIDNSNTRLGFPPDLAFSHLSRNSRFSDITFNLADGVLSAHKTVLFTRSEYFKTILLLNESLSSIEMPNYKVRIFEHFLDYLYKGKIANIDRRGLLGLNVIAWDLNDFDLFRSTLNEIEMRITSSSLKYVLRQAHEISSKELRAVAVKYINQMDKNGNAVVDLIESLLKHCE